MKKIIIVLFTIVFVLIIFFILMPKTISKSYVKINNKIFYVYIAKTNKQKENGLSIFNKLPLDKGMIFTYNTLGYYPFWMKNMKFPIDIIYINNNKIVDIFPNLKNPNRDETPIIVKNNTQANYVLEINADLSRKYNFKKGDLVEIKF